MNVAFCEGWYECSIRCRLRGIEMEFTIKRSEWARGGGPAGTRLYNPANNTRCCLGFMANAYELDDSVIADKRNPGDLYSDIAPHVTWSSRAVPEVSGIEYFNLLLKPHEGITEHNEVCVKLIQANDDLGIDEPRREERLSELFQSLGITVHFED